MVQLVPVIASEFSILEYFGWGAPPLIIIHPCGLQAPKSCLLAYSVVGRCSHKGRMHTQHLLLVMPQLHVLPDHKQILAPFPAFFLAKESGTTAVSCF